MSAKAAAAPADVAPEGSSGGGKKKLIIIVAALVVVLAAGGGAAFFLLGGKKKAKGHKKSDDAHAQSEAGDEEGDAGEEADDEGDDHGKAKPPVYLTLEPFTVNLAAEAADRYLQVGIDLRVAAPEVADKVKLHLPEIRNGILMILTSKRVEDLGTAEGKNLLRAEIRDAVNKPIGLYKPAPEGIDKGKWKPKKGVQDVLLTSFVIQ